jgi:hypothetical protein
MVMEERKWRVVMVMGVLESGCENKKNTCVDGVGASEVVGAHASLCRRSDTMRE